MTMTGEYIMISGKLYPLYESADKVLMFRFNNDWIVYEQDRDGTPLDKVVVLEEYPEWLV